MNTNSIVELYVNHIISPLEAIIKNPDFSKNYPKEEQKKLNQLLLHQYRELEKMIAKK